MKIAFVFPGYGSQFVGMGKELYDQHRVIQEYFEEASSCLNVNFVKLCFASSEIEINTIPEAYTSVFLVSSSIMALLKQEGINPDLVTGYAQGLYSAIFTAHGITFPDGLYLLKKFASFYKENLNAKKMQAIRITGLNASTVENLCFQASKLGGNVFVAVYETELVHIIAGDYEAVQEARTLISTLPEKKTVDIDIISTDIGLRSPLMQPTIDQFKIYLEKVDFKDLSIPLLTTSNGQVINQGGQIKDLVIKHISSPIFWTKTIAQLKDYDVIVHIGPDKHLVKITQEMYPNKKVFSINTNADIKALKEHVIAPAVDKSENNTALKNEPKNNDNNEDDTTPDNNLE